MARSKKKSKTKAKKPAKVSKVHPNSDGALRQELAGLLEKSHAHVSLKPALAAVPVEIRGVTPAGAPHSLWQLLEHLRIAQWDILEFSRDSKHVSPDWPSGYWPAAGAPPSDREWEKSLHAFEHELSEDGSIRQNPARHRPDDSSRSASPRRSQRLSHRPICHRAAPAWRLARVKYIHVVNPARDRVGILPDGR